MCKYCEEEQEYINSLEQLLIFMCQNNEDIWKELMDLGKQGNNAWINIPMIQGLNNIYVGKIAKLDFKKPKYGFEHIFNKLGDSSE